MVGELNILKEKQNKTKQKTKTKKKQENLTHLWDLKNKIITHLRSWKKQTNKNKTTRRQKLDPTPMPLEIKMMMCA